MWIKALTQNFWWSTVSQSAGRKAAITVGHRRRKKKNRGVKIDRTWKKCRRYQIRPSISSAPTGTVLNNIRWATFSSHQPIKTGMHVKEPHTTRNMMRRVPRESWSCRLGLLVTRGFSSLIRQPRLSRCRQLPVWIFKIISVALLFLIFFPPNKS